MTRTSATPGPRPEWVGLALGIAVCLAGGPAQASAVFARDLPRLTRDADAVVRGRVQKVEAHWSKDRRRIISEITIEVAQSYKGPTGSTVVVTQPGGVIGEIGQRAIGLAGFKEQEEVFVFLERAGAGRFLVAGLAQGKYRLEPSSDGKGRVALPESTREAILLDRLSGTPVARSVAPVPLEQLEETRSPQARKSPTGRSGRRGPAVMHAT